MLRSTSGYVSLKQSSASPRVSIGADFVHIIHGWCDTYCGEVWSRSCWWQDAAAVARTVQHRFATISVLALSPLHDGRDQTVSDLTPPKPSLCDLSHPAWRHHQLPIESLVIDTVSVDPVTSGRHLEVHLDSDMSIDTHLSALASTSWDKHAVSVDRCRVRRWHWQHWWRRSSSQRWTILQCCTGSGGPSVTWPWLTATVRHQCCCLSNDWSVQIWPRYAVTVRLTLCRPTCTNYTQVVRSRLQMSATLRYATLPTRSHSACRWSDFTTSTAVILYICPAGAANAIYHNWWLSVCRRWASCLE